MDSLTDHSCIPHRFGMTPLLDPFQMRIIKSVFNDSMLKVWNFNCGEKKKLCSLNRDWTADFHQRWGLWIWRHAAKGADGSQWWLWRWILTTQTHYALWLVINYWSQQDKRTEVATGFSDQFNKNPEYFSRWRRIWRKKLFAIFSRNFMVYLGKHTMPVFLFKGENKQKI